MAQLAPQKGNPLLCGLQLLLEVLLMLQALCCSGGHLGSLLPQLQDVFLQSSTVGSFSYS